VSRASTGLPAGIVGNAALCSQGDGGTGGGGGASGSTSASSTAAGGNLPPLATSSALTASGAGDSSDPMSGTPRGQPHRRESNPVKPLFKVHLPDNQKTLVPFQPSLKVAEILNKICSRRGLDSSLHYLTLADDELPLAGHLTVSNLGTTEVRLRQGLAKSSGSGASGSGSGAGGSAGGSLLSSAEGGVFPQAYQLLRRGRFAADRFTVTIHKDHVVLEKRGRSKIPVNKPITEITRAFCNADKPKQVTLEFSGEKAHIYEAESVEEATNIVNKLEQARKL